MSLPLRLVLIFGAVLSTAAMLHRIRKQKIQIEQTLFWILFSLMLVVMAFCPALVYIIAKPLGIISPANLVFAFLILILIIKMFLMTLEISQLEMKIRELTQHIAIKEAQVREAEENRKIIKCNPDLGIVENDMHLKQQQAEERKNGDQ